MASRRRPQRARRPARRRTPLVPPRCLLLERRPRRRQSGSFINDVSGQDALCRRYYPGIAPGHAPLMDRGPKGDPSSSQFTWVVVRCAQEPLARTATRTTRMVWIQARRSATSAFELLHLPRNHISGAPADRQVSSCSSQVPCAPLCCGRSGCARQLSNILFDARTACAPRRAPLTSRTAPGCEQDFDVRYCRSADFAVVRC